MLHHLLHQGREKSKENPNPYPPRRRSHSTRPLVAARSTSRLTALCTVCFRPADRPTRPVRTPRHFTLHRRSPCSAPSTNHSSKVVIRRVVASSTGHLWSTIVVQSTCLRAIRPRQQPQPCVYTEPAALVACPRRAVHPCQLHFEPPALQPSRSSAPEAACLSRPSNLPSTRAAKLFGEPQACFGSFHLFW